MLNLCLQVLDRSYTLMNVGLLTFLTAILVACGSGMRTSDEYVDRSKEGYTLGQNEGGQRYTGFDNDNSMEELKKVVEQDKTTIPGAMLLAQDIEWARFLSHARNEPSPSHYEVEIKWKSKTRSQIFRGEPRQRNNELVADLKPVNEGAQITMELTCVALAGFVCGKAIVVLNTGTRVVGGIEFIRQPKILQTIPSQSLDPNTLSPKAKSFFEDHKAGEPVIALSYSAVYGPSEVEVVEKTPQGLQTVFKTDLLDPEGEVLPVDSVGTDLKNLGQTTLVGNNARNLTILQEDATPAPAPPPKPTPGKVPSKITIPPPAPAASPGNSVPKPRQFVIRLTDTPTANQTGPAAQGHSICDVRDKKPTSPLAKSIIDEVLSTCDKEFVLGRRTIKMSDHRRYWISSSPATIRRLMTTYSEALGKATSEVAKRMKIALNELAAANFPVAALGITIQESGGFNPWAVSYAGAKSEWQIMPCTGMDLGIVTVKKGGKCYRDADILSDGRLDTKLATQAMAKYMKIFFNVWKYKDPRTGETRQNYPMALASYNRGPGTTQGASQEAVSKIKKGKGGRILSYGKLTEDQIRLVSSDFFYLAGENVGLSAGQIEYTMRILSGTQIILDPSTHGLNDLTPVAGN